MPGVVLGKNGEGYVFSQSAINKFRQCPEQARRIWFGLADDYPGDAALRGIIAHAGISDWLINEEASGVVHAMESAWQHEMMQGHPNMKSEHLSEAVGAMKLWADAYPMMGFGPLQDLETEKEFILELAPGVTVMGSRDVTHRHGVIDWKFSSARHWYTESWRHQRYDVQPTVYLAATALERKVPIETLTFHYAVVSDKQFNVIEVTRSQNDVDNLVREIRGIIRLCETIPEGPWPMNSNDWHCSPAWCPVFAKGECMGATPAGWITSHKDPQYVTWLNRK